MAELEERMSEAELRRWARFESTEPFVAFRIDLLGGLICSVLANIYKAKNAAPFEPIDFMPFLQRSLKENQQAALVERYPDEAEREQAALQQMFIAFGGRLVH